MIPSTATSAVSKMMVSGETASLELLVILKLKDFRLKDE